MVKKTVLKKFNEHLCAKYPDVSHDYAKIAKAERFGLTCKTFDGEVSFHGTDMTIKANNIFMEHIYNFFSSDLSTLQLIMNAYATIFNEYNLLSPESANSLINNWPDKFYHDRCMLKFVNFSSLNGNNPKSASVGENIHINMSIDFKNENLPVLKTVLKFPVSGLYEFVIIIEQKYNSKPLIKIGPVSQSHYLKLNKSAFLTFELSKIPDRIRLVAFHQIKTIIKNTLNLDKREIEHDIDTIKDFCSVCEMLLIG